MATSQTMRNPGWCDWLTLAAQDIRLVDISALLSGAGATSSNQLGIGSGVRPGPSNPMQVSAATGLSVSVNPGFTLVQSSTAANGGTYATCLDTAATLTCQTADLVNPRLDVVCVTVTDNGDATSKAVVQIITGTPAPVPSAPALPANSSALCQVTVPANATSLTGGNLQDVRMFSVAAGGIKPVLSSAQYPSAGQGAPSDFYYDMSTGRVLAFDGTSLKAPATAGFAPVTAGPATVTATNTTPLTITSKSVTTDAITPVEVYLTFQCIVTSSAAAGVACVIQCARDSTQLGAVIKTTAVANQQLDGGTITYPDTPGAGTHTYTFKILTQGSGHFQIENAIMNVKAISP